ncbi:hypothetical protein [Escherichia coli]|uniref:hypothetical protein n=1 Tax=Escherichia coli TaxID=562 RepID=UPI000751790A|nr:hypothetical protein AWE81_23395 [Escherichia coli]
MKYHCNIRHQVIDREIFRKRHCTEFGDKKPTTLPASATRSGSSSAGTLRGVSLAAVANSEVDALIKVLPRMTAPMLTEQGRRTGFHQRDLFDNLLTTFDRIVQGNHIFFVHGFLTSESGLTGQPG